MGKVLGIDLGTTNSCVAIIEDGQARIIANAEGAATTPSIVSFLDEENYVVGEPALHRVLAHPRTTVTSIKRFMGASFSDTEKVRAKTNYEVVCGAGDSIRVNIKTRERNAEELMAMLDARKNSEGMNFFGSMVLSGANGTEYSPEEISSFILKKLKNDAETAYGQEFSQAVITVPAYFNDSQRQATRTAGRLAGLEVLRIVSEPTAAALAYGIGSPDKDERVMIFDLGGGTFDVSVLEIKQGVFHVLSTYGDNQLGGDDWDKRLIDWMAEEFRKEHGIDLRARSTALERMHDAAIGLKIALSGTDEARVTLPAIAKVRGSDVDLDYSLTRRRFEQMTAGLMGRLKIPMDMAMEGAGLKVSDLDEVVLVGGSTRIPSVRKMVERYTRLVPNASVNPDEAVALGAAVQGGLLNGEVKGASLVDVTPLSLGVETAGGVMSVLIPRNTTIPAHAEQIYATTEDNQTAVNINVCQGERGIARDNKSLGRFRLEGIPAAPQGKMQIEVSFDIDANGIVSVCAREIESGIEQHISITGSTSLSAEDIESMLADAAEHGAEDEHFQRKVAIEGEANSLLYWTEKAIDGHASWVNAQQAEQIRAGITALREVLSVLEAGEGTDPQIAAVRGAIDELREARKPLEEAADEVAKLRGSGASALGARSNTRCSASAVCSGGRCPGCGKIAWVEGTAKA